LRTLIHALMVCERSDLLYYANMANIYSSRIQKALKLMKESGSAEALVLSSNPHAVRSRDIHYPYRQNSDLFYFTGSYHQELQLVLRPSAKDKVVLVAPPKDPVKAVWEGEQPSLAPLARSLGASLHYSSTPLSAVRELLRGVELVHLQSIQGTVSGELRKELSSLSALALRNLPARVGDAELLVAGFRCIKDASEVAAIREAAKLTSATLVHAAQYIRRGMREREIAALIDYFYRSNGGEPAFNSIVAAGKSAATLHYHTLERTLRAGELVLIDTGCELDMYACDVSRTIPVDGEISPELEAVYDIVLSAQRAAIKKVRAGVHISTVYRAAAVELTHGLKELGVLRGKVSQLVAKGAFKPWFPHGIGHSLGIDVHDVSPNASERLGVLQNGMVITIEPGLYFSKKESHVPACGVRIEDDVLVTSRGCSVLTEGVFPTNLEQVYALVNP
jgi:Xaa-Pro aminopeptidase